MSELYKFDIEKGKIILGVDEAGRGPLAGPVVAAAVKINEYHDFFEEINDSKKLTEKKRENLFEKILTFCDVGIGIATVEEIDEVNILNATFLAMNRAIEDIKSQNINYDIVLVDGNKLIKNYDGNQECIIKGDGKSLSIATASIIAKVTRDRIMLKFSEIYPEYHFEKHKGYGTKLHREILLEKGPLKIHRKTFLKKILSNF
ncbi:ribonuclease HII [Fusobacterium perfoetens]|uniref:ribonuclease HII n=1 Tax=Fusobacterium perfoetens TaxID=852 RepID=UPI0004860FA5|nr:ribonuclease HII [Fusobacterium perfoetens]MCI6152595.1 ribonuclease HII [Fusobacterium perfoetens]MDY3237602.1 ribonuclease HII [Fusobacterium perfoetens]